MVYVVGVSSGLFGVTTAEERPQLAGLFKKAQSSITKGVQFVQLDLDSISEFEEPRLKKRMEEEVIKKLGVGYGIHSETKAAGVEAAELDAAIDTDYKRGHERLKDILIKSGEIGSKYVLIHSSESEPFPFLERTLQPAVLVDFFGNPLREFLEKNENKWLVDEWLIHPDRAFMWIEIIGYSFQERIRRRLEDYAESYRLSRKEEPPSKDLKTIEEMEKKDLIRYFLDFIVSRHLHYGPERYAYYFIAKWMENEKDPLWINIVNSTIEFFSKRDNKAVEQYKQEKGILNLSIDDENFRKLYYLWVPAVSAKYIWGHLNQDKIQKERKFDDLKKIIKKYDMPLVLETPMAGRGMEEWLRLANPIQIYYLCKEVGFDYLQLAFDLEHMLSIRLDPELVINILPEDAGKFVKVIHAGWPATLAPAHLPIHLGSEQQVYLYKIYYLLRKKGFGLDPKIDHFIVFERGGPETFQESIISLRKIIECLEKNILPERLPAEFFGVATGEIASPERQLTTIREHAFDPLKGLITAPEEEHGFLGRAAVEKGKVEEWKKEKYR